MPPVTDSARLLEFCAPLLASAGPQAVAIDMEFMREATYWPRLCLIQMASTSTGLTQAILIDPLAPLDLSPVQAILAAPHLTKVFHSGRQDLEICWHEWQTLPVNYFDTQVAAMVCGLGESIGYSPLVHKLLGLSLEKDSQYTDWSLRPLTPRQVSYAQADVTHLPALYTILKGLLDDLKRWEWMEDDLSLLLNPQTYQPDPQQAWRRIYSPRHGKLHLAVLQDLCAWRETTAMRLDINRGRLLKDEVITTFATQPSHTREIFRTLLEASFSAKSGFSRFLNQYTPDTSLHQASLKDELFHTYQIAWGKPQSLWPEAPKKPSMTPLAQYRLNLLQEKLNDIAANLQVPVRLIAPKKALVDLAEGEVKDNVILQDWRYEIFGRDALAIIDTSEKKLL